MSSVAVSSTIGIYIGLLAYDLLHDMPVLMSGDTKTPIAFYTRGFASVPFAAFVAVVTIGLFFNLISRLIKSRSTLGLLQLALASVPPTLIVAVIQPTHDRFGKFTSIADEKSSMMSILYSHVVGFVCMFLALSIELNRPSTSECKKRD
jgi:hypothetical protein